MSVRVFKYQALGNDFLVLDRRNGGRDIDDLQTRRLCDRHLGVGADGVLVLLDSETAWARMVIHNADGSVPEMCGNGLRCAVKYLVDQDGTRPEKIPVDTGAGLRWSTLCYDRLGKAAEIEVQMGPAGLSAPNLPAGASGRLLSLPVKGLTGLAVSMGNPHLVLFDAPLDQASKLGPRLEVETGFPGGANVEFVRQEGERLRLIVWERGVGLTQACGTGACAAMAAAVHTGRLPADRWLEALLPGGALCIRVEAGLGAVHLRGPAQYVFEAVVPSGGSP